MKKYLILLLLLISTSGYAQWFKTTAFASATIINDTYYWGEWEESNVNIHIDAKNEKIIIYSPVIQIYTIYYDAGKYTDNLGGSNWEFYAIDADGDKCHIRLRAKKEGTSQLYVDFADVAWVYNII